MFDRSHGREVLLDRCVDALVRGDDWRPLADGRNNQTEVSRLMAVAEWLLELRKRTPAPGRHRRQRTWARVLARIRLEILPALSRAASPERACGGYVQA